MRFLLVLGFLVGLVAPSSSRVLHGYVKDELSLEPIAGASVVYRGSDGKSLRQTSTVAGEFRFEAADNGSLSIHAVGYLDTTVVSPASGTILMRRSPSFGSEVTVTATRHATAEQDVPVSISTVAAREVLSRAPQGLDNVLPYVPGVTITEGQVSIRGSSGYSKSVGSRVLLLLDGMPFLSGDNGDMKFDAIPLFDVERVEVVKGAGSALYGSSALGGVINVITQDPSPTPRFAANVYGGMYDQPKYEGWRVPELGRKFFSTDVGGSTTIGGVGMLGSVSMKTNQGYRLGDESDRINGFAKAVAPLSDATKLTVTALVANEDHGGWLYWKGLDAPLMPSDSLTAVDGDIHSFKANGVAMLSSVIGDDLFVNLKLGGLYTDFTTDPARSTDTITSNSSARSWNGELTASTPITNELYLTGGLTQTFQSVRSSIFHNNSGSLTGVFLQGELRPLDALTLTLGARADLIKYQTLASESQISPKFGVSWTPAEDLTLRGSYGVGFRSPTIGERFIEGRLSGITVKPNLNLLPERDTSYEIGCAYRLGSVSLDAAVFYSTFGNLIEPSFITTEGPLFIRFQNLTNASIFGHEESIEFDPFQNRSLMLRLGYTYIYPEDRIKKSVLQFRPRHLIQANGEYVYGALRVGGDFRYLSKYETYDTTLATIIVPDGEERVDSYVVDARIGADLNALLDLPLEATFQVQNLLNYYYIQIAGNLAPLRSYSLRLETRF